MTPCNGLHQKPEDNKQQQTSLLAFGTKPVGKRSAQVKSHPHLKPDSVNITTGAMPPLSTPYGSSNCATGSNELVQWPKQANGAPSFKAHRVHPNDIGHTMALDDDEQWPSINDSLNPPRSQPNVGKLIEKCVDVKNTPDAQYSASGSNNVAKLTDPTSNGSAPPVAASSNPEPKGPTRPVLTKSYKERADDYAKARLRILGSASADDDDMNDSLPSDFVSSKS